VIPVDTKLREKIAIELFDIWKDAKQDTGEDWGYIIFAELPEKHKHEYYLTSERIMGYFNKEV